MPTPDEMRELMDFSHVSEETNRINKQRLGYDPEDYQELARMIDPDAYEELMIENIRGLYFA